MSEFDLILRGGTVVDGSGGEPFLADVAIAGTSIAEVGAVTGSAHRELDATGKIVTPGFIDVHTHYDGQVTWENRLRPSSEYGVTTVVMGNCGVGFAPCHPHQRELLVKVMEGVEDIPELVLTTGIPWNWTTFPEYLQFLDTRSFDADCGAYLPHAALRVFVMGERAARREASTADDRERMRQLVAEAMRAGAFGVSSSRLLSHRDSTGALAPHVQSERAELMALAEGLRDAGKGVFQIAAAFANQQLMGAAPREREEAARQAAIEEVTLLKEICRHAERPVTFGLSIINDLPDLAGEVLQLVAAANEEPGICLIPQVYPRPIGILFGLELSLHPFRLHPSYHEIQTRPLAERVRIMEETAFRQRLLQEEPARDHPNPVQRMLVLRSLDGYPLRGVPDYEPDLANSLPSIAQRQGRSVEEVAYDALLEDGGRALLFLPINNFADGLDRLAPLLKHEASILGLGDGGAHLGLISDASYPTYFISYWTRERRKGSGVQFSLAEAVRQLTSKPAAGLGLSDRGELKAGMKADLNVLSLADLTLGMPKPEYDLPASGRRLVQAAHGIDATIVSGTITYLGGKATGALPGRLVRH